MCLMIIDIDEFKTVNDQYGHVVGDKILVQVAELMQQYTGPSDLVVRLGGDEFVILLPESDLEEGSMAAERLRLAISRHRTSIDIGEDLAVTISIGLAEARSDDDADSIVKRADSALYAAKEAGRNCSFRHGGPEPATAAACDVASEEETFDDGTVNDDVPA